MHPLFPVMSQEMYRQGDVLFVKVEKIPKKAKKASTDVIVEGEATGHAHRIVGGELFQEELPWNQGFELFINAGSSARIVHEEHGAIDLPKGSYKVVRQREYDPNATRWVED